MARIDISHPVTHIIQLDQNYCWACALAMILGRHSWQAALEIADRCARAPRDPNGALLPQGVPTAARALGLASAPCPPFSPAVLASRLRRGAVALFGRYNTGSGPFNHVMVVSMMRGDDTDPATLQLGVDDPWALESRWTGTFASFSGPILLRADALVGR